MAFVNTREILSLLSNCLYVRGVITLGTLRYYEEMPCLGISHMIISNQNNETKSLKLLRFGRYVMYGQQNVLREIFSKPVSIFAWGIQKIFACG